MTEVAGVPISHPERMIFRDAGLTKLDLARYFASVAEWMLPHVTGRPLTLVRCPEGIDHGCFFLKHSQVWAPPALRRVRIQEKTKVGEYLIADSVEAVVSLAQMGIVEIHTWNSVFEHLERPNRLVFDLDPGDRIVPRQVVEAARMVRDALAALDLDSFVKTTGGRGLHVVVPLRPHADWSECLAFSRGLSEQIAQARPELFTTRFARIGREGKILLDYLRNNRTNTSICAYSPRARGGAPVSVPLDWGDLVSFTPERFNVRALLTRLRRRTSEKWRGYWQTRQKLTRMRIAAVAGITSARTAGGRSHG